MGLVYFATLATLPKEVFWITDGGNRYIQLQNIETYEHDPFVIRYPAVSLDPKGEFFPSGGHHFIQRLGKRYSFYPFYFPLVSTVPFRWFGPTGLYLIPLLSSMGCFVLLYLVFRPTLGEGPAAFMIPVVGLCTPLFFYSLTLWEHTLAVLLFLMSIYLFYVSGQMTRHWIACLGSGVAMGLSTLFREEGYLLCLSVAAAYLLIYRRREPVLLFILGWLTVIIPLWIFQEGFYGHFLGAHAAVYDPAFSSVSQMISGEWLSMKLKNFWVYLFKITDQTLINLMLASPFLAAIFAGLFIKDSRRGLYVKVGILLASCVTSGITAAVILTNPEPVFDTLKTQSLVMTSPLLAFWFLFLRDRLRVETATVKCLDSAVLVAIISTCLALNQRDIGIIWGPRHFLSIHVLLVPLSMIGLKKSLSEHASISMKRLLIAGGIVLLALSLLIQLHGVRILHLKKHGSQRIIEAVRRTDAQILVTDTFWLPEELAALYFKSNIMMVQSDEAFKRLVRRLRDSDIENFCLATSTYYGRLSAEMRKKIEGNSDRTEEIACSGLEFMRIKIFRFSTDALDILTESG